MLRNDQIQAAIIAKLKANTTIVAELASSAEIKEDQYQGTEFSYPGVRVQLNSNEPLTQDANCHHTRIGLSILVFTEDDNTLEADRIAGIIHNELHAQQFTQSGIAISLHTTNLIPAIRSDIRTWRSQILMSGIASG
jgi:hypothetical protein